MMVMTNDNMVMKWNDDEQWKMTNDNDGISNDNEEEASNESINGDNEMNMKTIVIVMK